MPTSIPGGLEMVLLFLFFAVPVVGIAKVFQKAGENWWAAVIPLYNVYVMTKIADIHPVWILVWIIPYLNIVAALKTCVGISKQFGAGTLFGVGIALLPWIGWPLLGFGTYEFEPNQPDNVDVA